MTRSALFFLLLATLISPICFAQNAQNIHDRPEIKKIVANYKTTLSNLKQIGYPDVGYYPLCSDVISLEEKKIGEVFRKNCELDGKPNPNYCYNRNWDSLIASQKVYGRINSNAIVKPFYEPQKSMGTVCFSKDAAVNMLFVRSTTKLENYSTQKIDVDWHRTAFNKVSYDDKYAKDRSLVGASI